MEFSKTAAVIFDMDGIIFDTERLYIESWKAVAQEYDLNNVTDMAYRIIGVNDMMSRKVFTEYYQGTRDYDQCRKRVSEVFHSRYDGKIPVKSGVQEILAFLRERNIPVALASSTRIETVQRELKEAGLYQAFDHIIGGDMIKQSKPAPDIFLAAAEKLQEAPENCYVLEDSHNGIRAAAAAGMHPIMVPDLLEVTEEMQELAETVCPTLYEAIDYLDRRIITEINR